MRTHSRRPFLSWIVLLCSCLCLVGCAAKKKHKKLGKKTKNCGECVLTHEQEVETKKKCRKIYPDYCTYCESFKKILNVSGWLCPQLLNQPLEKKAFEQAVLVRQRVQNEDGYDSILCVLCQSDLCEKDEDDLSVAIVARYRDELSTMVKDLQERKQDYKERLAACKALPNILEKLVLFLKDLTMTKQSAEEDFYHIEYKDTGYDLYPGMVVLKQGTKLLAGSQLQDKCSALPPGTKLPNTFQEMQKLKHQAICASQDRVLKSDSILGESWLLSSPKVLRGIKLEEGVKPKYYVEPVWKCVLDGTKDNKLLLMHSWISSIMKSKQLIESITNMKNLFRKKEEATDRGDIPRVYVFQQPRRH